MRKHSSDLPGWMGTARRDRSVEEPGRPDEDLKGRGWRYLNVSPSAKALKKEREKLHEMTSHRQCHKPIPELIGELNRQLKGWKNYFDFGYPRQAFREINSYVRYRLKQHLRRRSRRPYRPPEGVSYYEHIQRLGWWNCRDWGPCNCLRMPETRRFQESRMPGNPLVRFDEGRVGRAVKVSPSLLLYRLCEILPFDPVDTRESRPSLSSLQFLASARFYSSSPLTTRVIPSLIKLTLKLINIPSRFPESRR
jgi:hypothetical protein